MLEFLLHQRFLLLQFLVTAVLELLVSLDFDLRPPKSVDFLQRDLFNLLELPVNHRKGWYPMVKLQINLVNSFAAEFIDRQIRDFIPQRCLAAVVIIEVLQTRVFESEELLQTMELQSVEHQREVSRHFD